MRLPSITTVFTPPEPLGQRFRTIPVTLLHRVLSNVAQHVVQLRDITPTRAIIKLTTLAHDLRDVVYAAVLESMGDDYGFDRLEVAEGAADKITKATLASPPLADDDNVDSTT